jgi:predicted amidohydrolase
MAAAAPLTLTVAQPRCTAHDVAANARTHAAIVRDAGARVVVFPELSLTGYELDAPTVALDDPALRPLVDACRATDSIALAGAPIAGDDGTEHIAMLAFDAVGVRVAYRKMFLGAAEADRFTPGTTPAVITVDGWRLGLAICKDTGVAEHAARTCELGVDVYVAGVAEAFEHDDVQPRRARRIIDDHRVFVAIASFAGPTGGGFDRTAGGSRIWRPGGEPIASCGPDVDDYATAALTPRD